MIDTCSHLDVALEILGHIPSKDTLMAAVFRKNNSRSRAFMLALAKQQPQNITNGYTIDTTVALSIYNKKQFHHIFPEAFLRRNMPNLERNYVLNFCMLTASENNSVNDASPQNYLPVLIENLGDLAEHVFRSNLLPSPKEFDYAAAELGDFIKAREPIVRQAIERLCGGDH